MGAQQRKKPGKEIFIVVILGFICSFVLGHMNGSGQFDDPQERINHHNAKLDDYESVAEMVDVVDLLLEGVPVSKENILEGGVSMKELMLMFDAYSIKTKNEALDEAITVIQKKETNHVEERKSPINIAQRGVKSSTK